MKAVNKFQEDINKIKCITPTKIQDKYKLLNMLHVKTLIKNFQFLQVLSEVGLSQEKLEIYETLVQEGIGIVLKTYKSNLAFKTLISKLEKLSCMLEFLQKNNQKICKIKYKYLNLLIQMLKFSKTSDLVSITKENLSNVLSTKSYEEKLGKLWLLTEIESSDSDMNSLSECVTSTELRSSHYFKTINPQMKKSKKTFCQFAPTSQQNNTENEVILKAKKLKLKLENFQKKQLKKSFEIYRMIYNESIKVYYQTKSLSKLSNEKKYDWKKRLLNALRPLLAGEKTKYYSEDILQKYKCVHSSIKRKAVEEFVKNLVTAHSRIGLHKIAYKDKKFNNCIEIDHREIKPKGIFSKLMSLGKLKDTKGRLIKSKHAIKIKMDIIGDFYVFIPEEYTNCEYREPNTYNKVCALDPGVRKFLTAYSSSSAKLYGQYTLEKLKKKCKTLDILLSKISKSKGKKKYMKLASHRLRRDIVNLRDDFHKKVAKDLCDNYSIILLPHFKVKTMLSSLNSKTTRNMCNWAHYKFKMYLSYLCKKRGCKLYFVNEDYTSKTCGNCGHIKGRKDTSEIYKCNVCKIHCDRDIMAARNIYLKNILV